MLLRHLARRVALDAFERFSLAGIGVDEALAVTTGTDVRSGQCNTSVCGWSSRRRLEPWAATGAAVVEPARPREPVAIIRVFEARLGDVASRLGRVDEPPLARVDADVTHVAATRFEPEKHEVARPQFVIVDPVRGGELFRRRAGDVDAFPRVNVGDEPAAVETARAGRCLPSDKALRSARAPRARSPPPARWRHALPARTAPRAGPGWNGAHPPARVASSSGASARCRAIRLRPWAHVAIRRVMATVVIDASDRRRASSFAPRSRFSGRAAEPCAWRLHRTGRRASSASGSGP